VLQIMIGYVGEGMAYLFCVWEFPGSNLGPETRCADYS